MARRIPGARFTIIEGAGHLSNIERPEAFNSAVLGFLKEHHEETRFNEPSLSRKQFEVERNKN
jgi:hypothetical protein